MALTNCTLLIVSRWLVLPRVVPLGLDDRPGHACDLVSQHRPDLLWRPRDSSCSELEAGAGGGERDGGHDDGRHSVLHHGDGAAHHQAVHQEWWLDTSLNVDIPTFYRK